jgi:hypothetical protein
LLQELASRTRFKNSLQELASRSRFENSLQELASQTRFKNSLQELAYVNLDFGVPGQSSMLHGRVAFFNVEYLSVPFFKVSFQLPKQGLLASPLSSQTLVLVLVPVLIIVNKVQKKRLNKSIQ